MIADVRQLPGRVLRSRRLRDYVLMTAGAIVTAYGLDAFLIPNRLAAGGLSGLSTILHYLALPKVNLPVGTLMLVMNLGLFAIAFRARGWRYAAKTIYGSVVLSVAIDAMARFVRPLATDDPLLAAMYGGAITGLGLGMVFKAGGNTGGTDIIAQLLVPKVSLGLGQLMLLADAIVMLAAAIVFGPNLALYGIVAVFVSGAVIDLVQEGLSVNKAAYIISDRSDEVAGAILNDLGRGATGFRARGLYTGEDREVIFTVVSRRELDPLKALVRSVDRGAFIIISDVHEVLGEGFEQSRE
jgi:uncharacterized membrane-anchored protein YitT (DUF2179 family)